MEQTSFQPSNSHSIYPPVTLGFIGNIPEPVGGAERFLDTLIDHLSQYPIKIVLARWLRQSIDLGTDSHIHYRYREKETLEIDEKRKLKTYYLFHISNHSEFLSFLKIIYHGIKTSYFFHKEKVSIIHCHLLIPNIYYGFIASRILRVPLIVTIHGLVDLASPGHIFKNAHFSKKEQELLIWILKKCDRVIAVSKEIKDYLLGQGITKIEQMSAGIDTAFFRPTPTEEHGILFVGNLNTRKGFDLLLEAYLSIQDEINEPLYLVGKDPNNFDGTFGNVHYLGCLTHHQLLPIIHKSKIVILPSRTEGLPLSILEAMACNKLVLVSPVGGLKTLITEGKNGFLLKELSAECIKHQLRHILNNYSSFKETIGSKPRQSILEFDVRRIADWHWNLYRDVITPNQPKT
jgi:glycosyltransferase involved in cell wall biosynthesis